MLIVIKDINNKEIMINPLGIDVVEINGETYTLTIGIKTVDISKTMFNYIKETPALGLSVMKFNQGIFDIVEKYR
ncbi:MAG: hypothetical protein ACRCX2_20750 [Paraclostridium sp.]